MPFDTDLVSILVSRFRFFSSFSMIFSTSSLRFSSVVHYSPFHLSQKDAPNVLISVHLSLSPTVIGISNVLSGEELSTCNDLKGETTLVV